jgi:hypothetical protein
MQILLSKSVNIVLENNFIVSGAALLFQEALVWS